MANSEHLEIPKQGVEVWNEWRKEHPKIRPDLSGADFTESYFRGTPLNDTNLTGANLQGADLFQAHFLEPV